MREPLSAEQRDALALPLDAWRLVFIDGRYHPQLSDDLAASGVEVSVDNQRQHLPDALQPEVFLHLTESLAQTVTRIRVPRNRRLDKPLLLMHITSGLAGDALNTAHYRHHLALESGAEATIVEHYLSLNEQPHFTGGRLTMTVADNAHLQHIKLAFENARSYHFAHNDLLLGRDASAFSSSFPAGGQVLRHQTSTRLGGENSNLRLNSLAMPVKNEVCDSRTWLDHQVGYCTSRQLHKTIVSDKGRAVFNGLINVAPLALKTDGQMTNNNLLLGRLAEVDTKPQLEIYADDVKCSHGATVGRIDEEQLFYLRSRGIEQQAAQQMIPLRLRRRAHRGYPQRRAQRAGAGAYWTAFAGRHSMTFSVEQVRADFPVLNREVNGQPLVYLDSAASAQKPEAVIGAEAEFYRHGYAAVHRGIHTLSAEATARMEPCVSRRPPSLTPGRRRKWCSSAAPPRVSTWWPTAGETPTSAPGITSSSAKWSTTPILCRGRCSAPASGLSCG